MSTPEPTVYISRILLLSVGFPILLLLPGFLLLKFWVKLRRETSFLTAVVMALAAVGMVVWRNYQFDRHQTGTRHEPLWLMFACMALLIIFAVPLGIKLYRAWTGIQISPEEQSPGGIGVRAWLTPGNLIVSALVAGSAAGAYDYPFFGVFGLLVGCLLIQPLINTASVPAPVAPSAAEPSLMAEREKVLSLLESGRITAEESAELLNALGSTSQVVKPAAPITKQQRMALIGAGLVLLGFFLPWFSYNPGKELNRMSGNMQQQMQGMMKTFSNNLPQGMPGMPEMKVIQDGQLVTPTVHISGGDIGKGLGWLVLALGLGTAALPYVATTMDSATRRMVSFISLGIGSIVLLWLVTQNLRHINIGVIVVLAGYAIEFLGLLNPRPRGAMESGVPADGRI